MNGFSTATKNLLKEAMRIAYYSKSSMSYETVLRMSALERDLAVEIIKEAREAEARAANPGKIRKTV